MELVTVSATSSEWFALPATVALIIVGVLWIGIILYRKWHDRDLTMSGFGPSWWFPLGFEWKLRCIMQSKEVTIGEGIFQIFNAVIHMVGLDKGVLRAYLGGMPFCVVWRADGIEAVLASNKLITKRVPYMFMLPWLGTGLLTSNGDKWRMRRKMLTPAFHFRILEDFLPIFNEHSRLFTQILSDYEGLKPVDIVHPVTMATLDIICETAMGVKIHAQENTGSEYVKALYVIGAGLMKRFSKPWLWLDVLYNMSSEGRHYNRNLKLVKNLTQQVIQKRKAEMIAQRNNVIPNIESKEDEIGVKRRRPFLDLVLENHLNNPKAVPIEGVQEEVDTFMFEGHDTTAMGISWALYLIASDPAVQAKVHQELQDVFGDDHEQPMTSDDLNRLKYLECCIKEAQRMYPSVPLIARTLTENTKICGHLVKANTLVTLHIYGLHRDPKVFPDPERFIPERFLAENSAGRHPFAYVPFSAGPRNCIGQKFAQMEVKVMIAWTLRRFKLRVAFHRDQISPMAELVTRPKNGIPIFIESRMNIH